MTSSIRKVDNGEKGGGVGEKIMMEIVATNIVASQMSNGNQLQRWLLVPINRKINNHQNNTPWKVSRLCGCFFLQLILSANMKKR